MFEFLSYWFIHISWFISTVLEMNMCSQLCAHRWLHGDADAGLGFRVFLLEFFSMCMCGFSLDLGWPTISTVLKLLDASLPQETCSVHSSAGQTSDNNPSIWFRYVGAEMHLKIARFLFSRFRVRHLYSRNSSIFPQCKNMDIRLIDHFMFPSVMSACLWMVVCPLCLCVALWWTDNLKPKDH